MGGQGDEGTGGRARLLVVGHPLVAHRVTRLRDERTDPGMFRQLLEEISGLVAYEALGDLATEERLVTTPVAPAPAARVVTESVLLVPILRAGLGMVPALQALLPLTQVAHVGLRRDERTLRPAVYLNRLPGDLSGRRVVICDPMLATGGSLSTVCAMAAERGATELLALCVIASVPGVDRVLGEHPRLRVACAALDPVLDSQGYIVPGLGDAGDRLFGEHEEG